jgi:hypothetical protein
LALLTGGDLLVLLSVIHDTGSRPASRPGGDRVGAVPVRPPLLTTRRSALGGALLGLTTAGCSLDRPSDAPRRAASAAAPAVADVDPDAVLVDDVLAELTSLGALSASVAQRFPRLREPARALVDLHAAHREALGDEVAAGPAEDVGESPRPEDATAALRLLRTRELRAQRHLVDWSVAAESGALARLLAAMSAGIAQQVATLPSAPRPKPTGR